MKLKEAKSTEAALKMNKGIGKSSLNKLLKTKNGKEVWAAAEKYVKEGEKGGMYLQSAGHNYANKPEKMEFSFTMFHEDPDSVWSMVITLDSSLSLKKVNIANQSYNSKKFGDVKSAVDYIQENLNKRPKGKAAPKAKAKAKRAPRR